MVVQIPQRSLVRSSMLIVLSSGLGTVIGLPYVSWLYTARL